LPNFIESFNLGPKTYCFYILLIPLNPKSLYSQDDLYRQLTFKCKVYFDFDLSTENLMDWCKVQIWCCLSFLSVLAALETRLMDLSASLASSAANASSNWIAFNKKSMIFQLRVVHRLRSLTAWLESCFEDEHRPTKPLLTTPLSVQRHEYQESVLIVHKRWGEVPISGTSEQRHNGDRHAHEWSNGHHLEKSKFANKRQPIWTYTA